VAIPLAKVAGPRVFNGASGAEDANLIPVSMSGETRAPMPKLGRGVCLRAPENASGRTSRRARHRCAAMRDGPPQWIRDRRSGNAAGSPQSNTETRSLCARREAGQPRCPGGESLLRFSLGRLRLPPFNNFRAASFRARGMIDRAIPVARFPRNYKFHPPPRRGPQRRV